jgi:hypothetical protein
MLMEHMQPHGRHVSTQEHVVKELHKSAMWGVSLLTCSSLASAFIHPSWDPTFDLPFPPPSSLTRLAL